MKKSKKQRKAENAKRLAGTVGKPKNAMQKFCDSIRDIRSISKSIDNIERKIDEMTRQFTLTNTTVKVENPRLKAHNVQPELYIVIAAIRDNATGTVYTGEPLEPYAGHTYIHLSNNLSGKDTTDGFVDNYRNFHDRKESARIAYEAGQCLEQCLEYGLLSTDYRHIGYFSVNF